jgi:hypothetical protein
MSYMFHAVPVGYGIDLPVLIKAMQTQKQGKQGKQGNQGAPNRQRDTAPKDPTPPSSSHQLPWPRPLPLA